MESMARGLLDEIDDPAAPDLRELQRDAMAATRDVLAAADIHKVSEGVIRRLSYTYYFDWETDDPEYMLLVQDPGSLQERHLEELRGSNPLADGCSKRDQIQVYRAFGESWLTGRNSDFSKQFFGALAGFGLIDLGAGWEGYITSGQLYHDFYLADVVKYRADGFGTRVEDVSYDQYLRREIEALDPEIIFTFGGSAWSALRRNMVPKPVADDHIDPSKMLDIHGVVHDVETPVETTIIPLSHMSGQVWWRYPPEDYIAELRWGLSMHTDLA